MTVFQIEQILHNFDHQKFANFLTSKRSIVSLRVPGGVQHGVWTHLHVFWIIRESIDITMLKPYHHIPGP